MNFQVIVENSSQDTRAKGAHGLSILILTNEHRILYDFGPRHHLVKNSKSLSIDLNKIDFAVLSHNHMDHGGDINAFCKTNEHAPVHVNSPLDLKLYTRLLGSLMIPVGIKIDRLQSHRILQHPESQEIAPNVHLLKLSKYASESTINKELFIKRNNAFSNDHFEHESALVINDNTELVVFCACSHHGVGRILRDVESYFPNQKIKAFVGGFHLTNPINGKKESDYYIKHQIGELKQRDATYYTGHCTGDFAFNLIKSEMKNQIQKLSTGMIYEL